MGDISIKTERRRDSKGQRQGGKVNGEREIWERSSTSTLSKIVAVRVYLNRMGAPGGNHPNPPQ
jgi:hypothetical protein